MHKPWYRFPLSGIACLFLILLWMWRSDTASTLERIWIGMLTIATGFGLWGLAQAFLTQGWVSDEAARYPKQHYRNAFAVAQTHVVTHGCVLATTVALLGFGVVQAFTAPVNPGKPPTRGGYILTGVFLLIGGVKTFLNIYLVRKRDQLVKGVQASGGD